MFWDVRWGCGWSQGASKDEGSLGSNRRLTPSITFFTGSGIGLSFSAHCDGFMSHTHQESPCTMLLDNGLSIHSLTVQFRRTQDKRVELQYLADLSGLLFYFEWAWVYFLLSSDTKACFQLTQDQDHNFKKQLDSLVFILLPDLWAFVFTTLL
jgi:hypothetical protein